MTSTISTTGSYMHPEPASPYASKKTPPNSYPPSARSTTVINYNSTAASTNVAPGVTREDFGTLSVGEKALAGLSATERATSGGTSPKPVITNGDVKSPICERSITVAKLKTEVDALKKDNETLRLENSRFKRLLDTNNASPSPIAINESTDGLHDTITALTANNRKLVNENSALRDEIKALRELKRSASVESDSRVVEVEKRNELLASAYRESTKEQESLGNTVRRERAVIQRERESWIREKVVMEAELDRYKQLLAEANDEVMQLQDEAHKYRETDIQLEIAQQELELAKLKSVDESSSKDDAVKDLRDRITSLESEREQLVIENKIMKKEVLKAKELKAKVMEELAIYQDKDVDRVSEVASLQASLQATTKKRHEASLRIQELEEDLAAQREVAAAAQDDNNKLKAELLSLTAENVELITKLEAAETKANSLQGEADRVADEYRAQLDAKDTEMFALKSQLSVTSWKYESVKSQLEAKESESTLDEMELGYNSQITEILSRSEERDRTWADKVESLNIELRNLKADFNVKLENKVAAETVRLQTALEQRQEECSRTNERLIAADKELQVLRNENAALMKNK